MGCDTFVREEIELTGTRVGTLGSPRSPASLTIVEDRPSTK